MTAPARRRHGPSACQQILDLVYSRSGRWVTSHEIHHREISSNPSQRIRDLGARGYEFSPEPYPVGHRTFTKYTLVSEPSTAAGVGVEVGRPHRADGDADPSAVGGTSGAPSDDAYGSEHGDIAPDGALFDAKAFDKRPLNPLSDREAA